MTHPQMQPFGSGDTTPRTDFDISTLEMEVNAPDERLSYWMSEVEARTGIDVQCGTSNFIGRMSTRDLGLCKVHGVQIDTPHRAVREPSKSDLIFANVQLRNEGARYNGRREVLIPEGSMIIYEAAEPYELEFEGSSEALILEIPRAELEKRVANLTCHLENAVHYDRDMVAMLAQLMRNVLQAKWSGSQAVQDSLAESVINLLVGTLYDSPEVSAQTPTHGAAAMLKRIKAHINENISDPNLGPLSTAETMGITVSYLHKIFLQNNSTLMQYVLTERLERCRRDIAKLDRAGGISQIAYNWGFNDASHFSRSFRKRFGMSPREYRLQVSSRNQKLDVDAH